MLHDSQHVGMGGECNVVQIVHVTPEGEGSTVVCVREDSTEGGFGKGGGGGEDCSSESVSSRSYGLSGLVPHINPLISSSIRLFASSSSSSGLILQLDPLDGRYTRQLHLPHSHFHSPLSPLF